MPDGSTIKRAAVSGLEFAKLALEELSKRTTNECLASDEKTHQVVAQMNVPSAKRTIKRIFQISYDEAAGLRRTEEIGKSTRLNSSHGYISYAVFCLKKQTR